MVCTRSTSGVSAEGEGGVGRSATPSPLAAAGTDKSRLLEARIWVKDISRDFAAMNAVWNAWIDKQNKPTRVCVEAPMARPSILVEVQVTAAA